jgi:hypothetical protein
LYNSTRSEVMRLSLLFPGSEGIGGRGQKSG